MTNSPVWGVITFEGTSEDTLGIASFFQSSPSSTISAIRVPTITSAVLSGT
jgi:hypothetical protein